MSSKTKRLVTNKGNPITASGCCRKRVSRLLAQRGRTKVRPRGLPELRRQSWEPG